MTYLEREGAGKAAVRIEPPASEARTPSHFICLIDVSESMADSNKLANVKHCASLLLNFLTPADELSIITFGESSKIVLKRLSMVGAAAATAKEAIQSLRVDGCTNLSAGLASVREVLEEVRESGSTLKQGLLLLTDGHANRGVFDPTQLRAVFTSLVERYSGVSFTFLAYGTDHNAELLKGLAEQTVGSYNVVETLDSAALSMGEALGGIISCVGQNVQLVCPPGTKVEGPHKISEAGVLSLGDLYAGAEVLLLLELPEGGASPRLQGTEMPALAPFEIAVQDPVLDTSRNVDIDLTRLRYRCAELFRLIRVSPNRSYQADIDAFRTAVADEAFNGNAIADMLRMEVQSLQNALDAALTMGQTQHLRTMMMQHEAYTGLGRGTTSLIQPGAAPAAPVLRRARAGSSCSVESVGDPNQPNQPGLAATRSAFLSPTTSGTARRVAQALQTASLAVDVNGAH